MGPHATIYATHMGYGGNGGVLEWDALLVECCKSFVRNKFTSKRIKISLKSLELSNNSKQQHQH